MLHSIVGSDRGRNAALNAVERLVDCYGDVVVGDIGHLRRTLGQRGQVLVLDIAAGIVVRLFPTAISTLLTIFHQQVADTVVCFGHVLDEGRGGLDTNLLLAFVFPVSLHLDACRHVAALDGLHLATDAKGLVATAIVWVEELTTINRTAGIARRIQLVVVQCHRVAIVNGNGDDIILIDFVEQRQGRNTAGAPATPCACGLFQERHHLGLLGDGDQLAAGCQVFCRTLVSLVVDLGQREHFVALTHGGVGIDGHEHLGIHHEGDGGGQFHVIVLDGTACRDGIVNAVNLIKTFTSQRHRY